MYPPWKYCLLVDGLGDLHTLFLPTAIDDRMGFNDLQILLKSDTRVIVRSVFRASCILDQLWDNLDFARLEIAPYARGNLFLVTGLEEKTPREVFLDAEGPKDAIRRGRELVGWKSLRIHQLEPIH